ncbi:MAG: MmgE/PrpD family protein [Sphingomonadaceae bacterium]|nr:MmgE/PrpD family protein [Sphingomonadaceae bacterium]
MTAVARSAAPRETDQATATERLIARIADAAAQADPVSLERSRFCLLDWLGVTLAGAREPLVDVLAADAEPGADGHVLIGRSERVGLRDAVLINGAAGHALDYDDGMPAMGGHPSVAILPALVATAAAEGISGDRLLRAIVAGAEAAGRVGAMMAPDHYDRGYHCTGTVGAIAGTAACALLIGLDPGQTASAIGLAATRAAGLKASFGNDGKPLHAAWASLIALTSARWAARGMVGSADAIGHRQGFGAAASATFDAERGLAAGNTPHILTITFKSHAACAITHPSIDVLRRMRSDDGLDPERIRRIRIAVAPQANDICNIADPRSGLELKFSLRGTAAMAAGGVDTANPASYGEATASDPAVRSLIGRTEVELLPALALGESAVTVELSDGSSLTGTSSLRVETDAGILRDRLTAKFAALATPILGADRMHAIEAAVLADGDGPILRDLLPLCATTR